jgi:quercetin dioxygenase-like cupin family protein
MILRNAGNIEPIEIKEITFKGVKYPVKNITARWLVHKDLGGEEYVHNHALRHFTIGPSSEIPLHQHKFVEIIYILGGKLISTDIDKEGKRQDIEVGPGDCLYHYSDEVHGFKNPSDTEPATLLCCIDCIGDKGNCIPTSRPRVTEQ